MKRLLAVLVVISWTCLPVRAGVVDFEDFSDGDRVGTVVTDDNEVTFKVGEDNPDRDGWVTDVGGTLTAFQSNDGQGTPTEAAAGSLFLSDERSTPPGEWQADHARNYYIEFAYPVSSLELDLFDFRADGGAAVGDTATLEVFADTDRTDLVDTDSFTVTDDLDDGNVVHLGVSGLSEPVRAAVLTVPNDKGTGIDNVEFTNAFVEADVEIDPDTLNLRSRGRYVTAFVELPEGCDVNDIDPESVGLVVDGSEMDAEPSLTRAGDHDEDGVQELMVKFARQDLVELIEGLDLDLPAELTLTLLGLVGDIEFRGSDALRIVEPGGGPGPAQQSGR